MPYHGKLLLGLTGNIACGKSTVLQRLSELGAYTIDADAAIHTILKHDGPAYKPVVAEFGKSILQPDGEIDRRAWAKSSSPTPRSCAASKRSSTPSCAAT